MAALPSVARGACLIVLFATATASAADWKPVDRAELALAAPKVEPGADAEALFWEVRVADEIGGVNGPEPSTIFEQYVRIKIFTDRGREAHATVDIPYTSSMRVTNVAARTLRPDGSIVELKGSDIYRRTIVKREGLKIDVVSFALPAVERGAIVEFRWREIFRESLANYLRLPFSREIPVQQVRYYIKPLSVPGLNLRMEVWPFNAELPAPARQNDGYSLVSLTNIPADRDEPYATPRWERRPWMFVHYTMGMELSGERFWQQFSKQLHQEYSRRAKPNDEIRKLAAAAVAAARTDQERTAALVRVVRERLKRVDVDTADAADRRKAKDNKNAADALKRGLGTEEDVVLLYIALATAAGLDARVVAAPNRGDMFLKSAHAHPYFVRGRLVAIRSANDWTFVDPANEYSATGSLRWEYELQRVLIGDPKEAVSMSAPLAPASTSVKRRGATLRLTEDGTLEGECHVTYSGHWDEIVKEEDDQEAQADREKQYRDLLLKRWPGADITNLRIENAVDAEKPYTASFNVRIPGYAQRTGSRLVVQPALFQRGLEATFTGETRSADVYFPFPWTEQDRVTIELPAGFELEQPEAPSDLKSNVGRYSLSLKVVKNEQQQKLLMTRDFAFGLDESILFNAKHYSALKQFFDHVHSRDVHSLVLRRRSTE